MKEKKVTIKAYYCLNGEYTTFPHNPLHNKTFENVDVKITNRIEKIAGESYKIDVVKIGKEDPIDCELVSRKKASDGTLVIGICQDWG